jgi:hypothetical protein
LRATLVNGAETVRDADERWLYQRVNRARLAPQGICVLDPSGQVLAWVQMFDDDQSVLDFLEHGLKRFREKREVDRRVLTERFMRFPGEKGEDFRDQTKLPAVVAAGHPKGKHCVSDDAKGAMPPGSLVARLVGRALDGHGKPVADTVRQEHYVEDQFTINPDVQQELTKALADAEAGRVRLPDNFSKLCATHAHLGHIDVQPCLCMIKGRAENKGEWKRCEFFAQRVAVMPETSRWRVDGRSEVASAVAINGKGVHDVTLAWDGFIEVEGQRVTRVLLAARGTEKLQFAKDDHPLKKVRKDEVAFLPAGRPIDLECGVRYGIVGEPAPAQAARAAEPAPEIPDEARKQLVEALGGPFIVFRDKVQDELKLADEQKKKVGEELPGHIHETMRFFEKLGDAKPDERDKALQEHRRKSDEKLSAVLKDVLEPKQQHRLLQLQLQQAGAFALLGRNEAFAKLEITDEQRKQFMAVVQQMERKIQPLIKEAQSGGDAEQIRPRVMKIRKDHEAKIEALLSEAQKKTWKELLGKRFDPDD